MYLEIEHGIIIVRCPDEHDEIKVIIIKEQK
jgi:hypothetical protein